MNIKLVEAESLTSSFPKIGGKSPGSDRRRINEAWAGRRRRTGSGPDGLTGAASPGRRRGDQKFNIGQLSFPFVDRVDKPCRKITPDFGTHRLPDKQPPLSVSFIVFRHFKSDLRNWRRKGYLQWKKYIDYGEWQDLSLCENVVGHIHDCNNGGMQKYCTVCARRSSQSAHKKRSAKIMHEISLRTPRIVCKFNNPPQIRLTIDGWLDQGCVYTVQHATPHFFSAIITILRDFAHSESQVSFKLLYKISNNNNSARLRALGKSSVVQITV